MAKRSWKLEDLRVNEKNPRRITQAKLEKLAASIERDPQFMVLRPIVIDETNLILGGTQRYHACLLLEKRKIPYDWAVRAKDLSEEQKKRFILVDNAPDGMAGEWDFDVLGTEWEIPELETLGFDPTDFASLGGFSPNDNPDFDDSNVSDEDINKKAADMADNMDRNREKMEAICPECGHEFELEG